MNYGSFETHPEHIIGGLPRDRMNYDWHPFGGENMEDLTRRIRKTIEEIAEAHKEETGNILCVTHSIAILAAVRSIDKHVYDTRMQQEQYIIDNCSVTTMDWKDGVFSIHKINAQSVG